MVSFLWLHRLTALLQTFESMLEQVMLWDCGVEWWLLASERDLTFGRWVV